MKATYHVDESREGYFVVIERVAEGEGVVGEYRFIEDAEEHAMRATARQARREAA